MHWTGRHSLLHHPAANKPVDGNFMVDKIARYK
jgi:hypothetical protein